MDDVKKRFAEFRRRQEQQKAKSAPQSSRERSAEDQRVDQSVKETSEALETRISREQAQQDVTNSGNPTLPPSPQPTPIYITLLKLLLWGLLWGFFIEVGFGSVFFITSLLYLLVTSLRGSRRLPWEPSAYSVFNKNCEAIEGTLSAEQFERELRYGPMNVRR